MSVECWHNAQTIYFDWFASKMENILTVQGICNVQLQFRFDFRMAEHKIRCHFFFCLFRLKRKLSIMKWYTNEDVPNGCFMFQCVNLSLNVCLAVIIILNCFKLILTTNDIMLCYRIGQNWRTLTSAAASITITTATIAIKITAKLLFNFENMLPTRCRPNTKRM